MVITFLNSCQSRSTNEKSRDSLKTVIKVNPKLLTEEELKQLLLEKECENGIEYLGGIFKYVPIYKNALSMKVKGLKITCNITNSAVLATFKDIKVNVKFISKTGTKILLLLSSRKSMAHWLTIRFVTNFVRTTQNFRQNYGYIK